MPPIALSWLRDITLKNMGVPILWPMAATGPDPDHSTGEYRYITFAVSDAGRLLVVSHTDADETIRIISARAASRGERKIYEDG